MQSENIIQYDTENLKVEWEIIAKSRMGAMEKITRETYFKIFGLSESDPPELWRFAVGRCEWSLDLTKTKTAKALEDHFRSLDPQFAGGSEIYKRFRDHLGTSTLRDTVLAISNRCQEDPKLSEHISKLLAIYKHGPISQSELENNGIPRTAQLLLVNWIREPFGNITGSVAFFSDRAMAKLIYYLDWGKWMPPEQFTKEPERVRKLYRQLNLIPANARAIKDLDYTAGKMHFIPFKTATPKGR